MKRVTPKIVKLMLYESYIVVKQILKEKEVVMGIKIVKLMFFIFLNILFFILCYNINEFISF